MKLIFKAGSTSKMCYAFVQDVRYGDGRGLTGLAYNTSSLSGYYWRPGATSATSITLQTSTLGTYTSGSFKELDATNMPGVYEIGIPDAALAAGASHCILQFKGAANMSPVLIEIELAAIQPAFEKNVAFSGFSFMMFDSTTGDPKTGLTVTSTRSIDGGAFASCANSASEVSAGLYKIDLAATDLNGNIIALKFTATGAKQTTVVIPTVK